VTRNTGYFDFKQLRLDEYINNPVTLNSLMLDPLLNAPNPRYLENYSRIIAFALDLRSATLNGEIRFLHHSTTIKAIPPLKLTNNPFQALDRQQMLRSNPQLYSYRSAHSTHEP
jgi:hypothetical protein